MVHPLIFRAVARNPQGGPMIEQYRTISRLDLLPHFRDPGPGLSGAKQSFKTQVLDVDPDGFRRLFDQILRQRRCTREGIRFKILGELQYPFGAGLGADRKYACADALKKHGIRHSGQKHAQTEGMQYAAVWPHTYAPQHA